MTEQQQAAMPGLAQDEVAILLRAQSSQLPVVRGVAADMAMRADFDLDTVEDMKLAVDELVSTLIRAAAPGSTLSCRFRIVRGGLRVHGRAAGILQPTDAQSFSWRVLNVLSDEVRSWSTTDGNGAGAVVHIEMARSDDSGGHQ